MNHNIQFKVTMHQDFFILFYFFKKAHTADTIAARWDAVDELSLHPQDFKLASISAENFFLLSHCI